MIPEESREEAALEEKQKREEDGDDGQARPRTHQPTPPGEGGGYRFPRAATLGVVALAMGAWKRRVLQQAPAPVASRHRRNAHCKIADRCRETPFVKATMIETSA